MGKMQKTLSGIALAMIVAFAVTFGSFNKSFAARWCIDGLECEGIAIYVDPYDPSYDEWALIVGWCGAGTNYGSGEFFGCVCGNSWGAVPWGECSAM